MADEAGTPAGDDGRARRWGPMGYAGAWVRADDVGTGERVRWIEDDGSHDGPDGWPRGGAVGRSALPGA